MRTVFREWVLDTKSRLAPAMTTTLSLKRMKLLQLDFADRLYYQSKYILLYPDYYD